MAELLGVLLALLITTLGLLVARVGRRAGRALAGLLPRRAAFGQAAALRGRRLRIARARARAQAARIAALTGELERTRRALRLAGGDGPAAMAARCRGPDDRFRRAKRAFALLFHPDRCRAAGREEARIRRAVFQEFWAVLQRIERG
jgi:hypothetical protein